MTKGKIAVIGANQNALAFAIFAAREGFEVTLFEAKQKNEVAYDWTDDMAVETFAQLGLPEPPAEIHTRKRCWSFVPPNKEKCIFLYQPEDELDYAMYRRPFNDWLEQLALEAGANVNYSVRVKELKIENGRVAGIILFGGDEFFADLVVDCGGVNSIVRESLPEEFGIECKCSNCDTFSVRRSYFVRPAGTARPEHTNKAYLKHMNENGISWCLLSYDEKAADVLIGRVGEMSDEAYFAALDDLRVDNEIIGDKIIKGGELLQIPVRHPISKMFADGYALVGDSAFMTIPMLGSGMASGMRAARILAQTIARPCNEPFCSDNLYFYQKKFMEEIGATHAAIDLMKNWLLKSREGELDFLLCNGVVSESVLRQGATGRMVKMSLPELLKSGIKGVKKPKLLIQLAGLLVKMEKQRRIASHLPEEYDEVQLKKWQQKYEKVYQKELLCVTRN